MYTKNKLDDRQAYLKIIMNDELRNKWIKIERLEVVVQQKVMINQIKKSELFIYHKHKDAVKALYPYGDIVDLDTLLNYFDNHRTGVEFNDELKLAYPSIQQDMILLEKKMWIFSILKRNSGTKLTKTYLVNDLNFRKKEIINVFSDVPRQFQFQFNPQYYYSGRNTYELCNQMNSMLSLNENQKGPKSGPLKKEFQLSNIHLLQSNRKLYDQFQEAIKKYEI